MQRSSIVIVSAAFPSHKLMPAFKTKASLHMLTSLQLSRIWSHREAQAREWLDILNLVSDAAISLALYQDDIERCKKTVCRIRNVIQSLKSRVAECFLQILKNEFPASWSHFSQWKGFNPCV